MRRRTILITVAACGVALAVAVGISLSSGSSLSGAGRYRRESLIERGDVYHYLVYVPSNLPAGSTVPLVVVLHGCNMTADQMAGASAYSAMAEQRRFIVLYPDIDAADAGYGRCWKGIWEPGVEGRGRGDAGAIAEMTAAVMTRWRIDRDRVYAIGISAGAFETAILGVAYPDLYAAVGLHSGAAYGGGEPACLAPGESPAPTSALSRAAFDAMGARARVVPIIVIHGDQDDMIPYQCGQQALAQWLATDDLVAARAHLAALPSAPSRVARAAVRGGHSYTVASYTDTAGCVVGQLWTVHGMGHFWSGGSSDPSSLRYSDPLGPSATAASWAFFSRWRLSATTHACSSHAPQ